VGDPIEAGALGAVVGAGRRPDHPCWVGSAKTNIGHLEAAAGVAGLIKAVLCLEHRQIPPHLHLERPNPLVPFAQLGLRIPRRLEPWPDTPGPARAGVSAFGYGGTNAHVVLEEAPARPHCVGPDEPAPSLPQVLPLSTHCQESLQALARAYLARPELQAPASAATLRDLCYSAGLRDSQLDHRLALVAHSVDELRQELEAFLAGTPHPGLCRGQAPAGRPRLVFVYTGMGPPWWAMGRGLLRDEPIFRASVERIDGLFRSFPSGWSVLDELLRDEADSRMARTEIAQTANFAVQAALTDLLSSWGVEPAAVVGHSVGEVAAAYATGALSLEDAVRVSFHRARLQARTAGHGRMLAAGLSVEQAQRHLRGHADRAVIAAVNSPLSVTLSGEGPALEEIARALTAEGRFNRFLQVEVAYHSPHMDSLRDDLLASLEGLRPGPASVPLYSTVAGGVIDGPAVGAEYWWRNVRAPVQFAAALGRLAEDGHDLFLEIGPHPALSASITECLRHQGRPGNVLASLHRKKEDRAALVESLGKLFALGYRLDWRKLHPHGGHRLRLPAYPWQREYHWSESAESRADRLGPPGHPLLGQRLPAPQPTHEVELHDPVFPYLTDHRIEGRVVFPGAGYVEAALAVGVECTASTACALEEIEFHKALVIDLSQAAPLLHVTFDRRHGTFAISSRPGPPGPPTDATWVLHATGKFLAERGAETPSVLALEDVRGRCQEEVPTADLYTALRERGLEYGPCFQAVVSVWRGREEVLGRLELPEALRKGRGDYRLHPVLLDAAFQSLAALLEPGAEGGPDGLCLPVAIERVRFHAPLTASVWAHGRIRKRHSRTVTGDVVLGDETGRVLVEVGGLRYQFLAGDPGGVALRRSDWLYSFAWRPQELPPRRAPDNGDASPTRQRACSLLFMDSGGIGWQLALALSRQGERAVVVFPGATRELLGPSHFRIRPDRAEDLHWLVEALGAEGPCQRVVYLWGLDIPAPPDVPSLSEKEMGLADGATVLHLVQALELARTEENGKEAPRLWLVTCGAQQVGETEGSLCPAAATLWGLSRVIAAEHPELRCSLIDLGPAAPEPGLLAEELLADDQEHELALREGARLVRRMVRLPALPDDTSPERQRPDGPPQARSASDRTNRPVAGAPGLCQEPQAPLFLEVSRRGSFDSLQFRCEQRRPPARGEVTIRVRAAGLNFKDVLKAMGVLSERIVEGTLSGEALGLECAGVIAEVGEGVEGLKVGDEVVACAPGCFRTLLTVPASLVFPKLPGLTFEQEAALPVVFLTAYYALHEIARLEQGERVLIHAATGGVGLAAIQVARSLGAEIYATAGSPRKRDFLRSLGVAHIMDSRSLEFADQIRERTAGRGVDVVLNSLAGEALVKGLGVLAPYGRFIEIGKRDIDENNPLHLRPFNRNLSFTAIDIDRLIADRPAQALRLMREVRRHFQEGTFAPLPTEVFPATQVGDAFRHLAQAKHIGKVVLSLDTSAVTAAPAAASPLRFGPDASYLITGGLGGVGLKLAAWLVEHGARHLVLAGRSGAATAEARRAVQALEQRGAVVRVAPVDMGLQEQVAHLLSDVARAMPKLRGVFHAAMVLDDGLVLNLDRQRYANVLAPKALGAWHLHALTQELSLDYFVLFSSVVAEIGNPGQAGYAAANAFLDALAHHRRGRGLPALSVNWGPLGGAGIVARKQGLAQHLARQGWKTIPVRQALEVLGRLLSSPAVPVSVADVDWLAWSRAYPAVSASPRFAELLEGPGAQTRPGEGPEATWRETLLGLEAGERRSAALGLVQEAVARVLGFEPAKLDIDKRLDLLGVDSLMAVELQHVLYTRTGLELSAMDLMQGLTVAQLAGGLLARIDT
jgi:acyl transferase domain-containing protein/Zn-dependent alcohol dehydrogenase/short-subunit dehydrogenase/acyl carrier protein